MEPVDRHSAAPDVSFEGGDLDCGNGLLLLIRRHIDPMKPGQLLEIRSTELSVEEDLPAWCRLTGNDLLSWTRQGRQRSFLVRKGGTASAPAPIPARPHPSEAAPRAAIAPATVPKIAPLSVLGIGSWPRPAWLVRALHEKLEGRLPDPEFQAAADDAVRLCVDAQLRAGVDVVTDGEQRRDNYASFVGGLLDNCQLIPLTDLLPLVDDPEKLRAEMASLDVPASEVRHPAVFGRLRRSRPIARHELDFLRTITDLPVKVALPGPYLLSRTLWMECISDRAYGSREELAEDIVRVLREELHDLLAAGAAIVQFDEPVLTEVVFSGPKPRRSFMCGTLSARAEPEKELAFALDLLQRTLHGFSRERLAMHVCRGNWTPDERAALAGDYRPLLDLFRTVPVGTLFLEACTPRAGELDVLQGLPESLRLGLGVVNQKNPQVESVEEILQRMRRAVDLFGSDRLLFSSDCGFATFADNPVSSARTAEEKLRAIRQASGRLRSP